MGQPALRPGREGQYGEGLPHNPPPVVIAGLVPAIHLSPVTASFPPPKTFIRYILKHGRAAPIS